VSSFFLEVGLPYIAVLDNFARLYLDMGYPEIAISVERHMLPLCEKVQDHAAIARSYVTLANLELNRGRRNEGKKYLSRALQEEKSTNNLDEDFFATIASTEEWLAQLDNDKVTAISNYSRAVELWSKRHGDQYPLTGWGYMLLGRSYAQAGQLAIALEKYAQRFRHYRQDSECDQPEVSRCGIGLFAGAR
jgi:tetratricopeptide (TPR) repeat protein